MSLEYKFVLYEGCYSWMLVALTNVEIIFSVMLAVLALVRIVKLIMV